MKNSEMAGHGGAAPTLNPEGTCTCTRLEVRQRTDSVGVVPSKTQRHVRVPVRIGTFERGIEVFYLPTSLAGLKMFRTGLFSLFSLLIANHRSFYYSPYKNNKRNVILFHTETMCNIDKRRKKWK